MTLDAASRIAVAAALVAMIAIRAPHGQRSRSIPVARSFRDRADSAVLAVAMVSFVVPVAWLVCGALDAAERVHSWTLLSCGCAAVVGGLWLFHCSHADLGTNWSVTLEIREGHTLVTSGVYSRIRHPMYTSLLLYSLGLALALPNWIAGPSYLASMLLLVAVRLAREERMMAATFGDAFTAWSARTARLVPFVW
ncbi:MAG: isoprenylcysteine carboxylmethyltransferase family protein [Planctomycetes bacterium]|nr:isoprenylcysteine carboxylmethyltransferase family protein [Planctomycetota bacterium]